MKKKFFAALLAMAMVLLMVPFAMAQEEKLEPDTAWYSDETTEYTIETAEELAGLAQLVSGGNSFSGKTINLGANIDLNSCEWTPIGVSGRPFSGTFNGNGNTISNLVITQPETDDIGLFGYTTGGEIKNFTLENARVTGYLYVGAVAGTPYTSKYTDIEVTGRIQVKGYAYVGGALGKNAYADITDVNVTGDSESYVYADSENYRTYVGGLVGFMGEGAITIEDCDVVIDVTGSTCDVGGLLGILHYGNTMKNCTYKGSLTLTNPSGSVSSEFGALTGTVMNSTMPATITDVRQQLSEQSVETKISLMKSRPMEISTMI